MRIRTQCHACDASFLVPEEYLGRRVKCPKCKEAIRVEQHADDDDLKPAEPRRKTSSSVKASSKVQEEVADDTRQSRGSRLTRIPSTRQPRHQQKSAMPWIISGAVLGIVGVGAMVVAAVVLLRPQQPATAANPGTGVVATPPQPNPSSQPGSPTDTNPAGKPTTKPATEPVEISKLHPSLQKLIQGEKGSESRDQSNPEIFTVEGMFSIETPPDGFQWTETQRIDTPSMKGRLYVCTKKDDPARIALSFEENKVEDVQRRKTILKANYNTLIQALKGAGCTDFKGTAPDLKSPIQRKSSFSGSCNNSNGIEVFFYSITIFDERTYLVQATSGVKEEVDQFAKIADSLKELPPVNLAQKEESFPERKNNLQQGDRMLRDYPINIPIPKSFARVTRETPLEVGTVLKCCWGQKWYQVEVLELHEDGAVKVHWPDFGSNWDEDVSRDCLIIDKKLQPKSETASDDQSEKGKSNAQWTNNIKKMVNQIPDTEVSGKLYGRDFNPDKIEYNTNELVLRQGSGFFADLEISIILFQEASAVAGKKCVVNGRTRAGDPHIRVKMMKKGDRVPTTEMPQTYLLSLEFGKYDEDTRTLSGKIYICFPDQGKSFCAGTFDASVR